MKAWNFQDLAQEAISFKPLAASLEQLLAEI